MKQKKMKLNGLKMKLLRTPKGSVYLGLKSNIYVRINAVKNPASLRHIIHGHMIMLKGIKQDSVYYQFSSWGNVQWKLNVERKNSRVTVILYSLIYSDADADDLEGNFELEQNPLETEQFKWTGNLIDYCNAVENMIAESSQFFEVEV